MPTSNYRTSHTAPGKGQSYETFFRDNPHRAVTWRIEQRILDTIIKENFAAAEFRMLDFACGTGRILCHLEQRASESVGVDLSQTMLDVARSKVQHSEIIEADLTRTDVLNDRKFDLITAFRFFPNAEPQLRSEAITVLARYLSPNGLLVFNNHKNSDSWLRRLVRLLGRENPKGVYMSDDEATSLVATAGLVVVKRYHVGVIPVTEKHPFLPPPVLYPLERMLSRCSVVWRLATIHIYVCRRAPNS